MSRPPGTMKDSNIGRLPPELRNSISELVLQAHFEGECCDHTGRTGTRFAVVEHIRGTTHHNKFLELPQLLAPLQVCSQMRDEAILLLFGSQSIWLAHSQARAEEKKDPDGSPKSAGVARLVSHDEKDFGAIELTQDNLRIPTRLRATRGSNLGNQTTRTWVGVQNWDRYAHHSGGIKQARRGY
jgi:hypothetical protein